jgi:hypothetical protein
MIPLHRSVLKFYHFVRTVVASLQWGYRSSRPVAQATIGTAVLLVASSAILGACSYTLTPAENPTFKREKIRYLYVEPMVNNTYRPGVENVVYNEVLKAFISNERFKVVEDRSLAHVILRGSVNNADYSLNSTRAAINLGPSTPRSDAFQGSSTDPVASSYEAVLSCHFELVQIRKSKEFLESEKVRVLEEKRLAEKKTQEQAILAELEQSKSKAKGGKKGAKAQLKKGSTDLERIGQESAKTLGVRAAPGNPDEGATDRARYVVEGEILKAHAPDPEISNALWSGNFERRKPFLATNQLGTFGTTSSLINDSEFDRALIDLANSIGLDMHEDIFVSF